MNKQHLLIFCLLWTICIAANAEEACPNDEIWYTSSDGKVVTPYKTDTFGATIISNSYSNGKGIIKFDGNITAIGSITFYNRSNLTNITIPNSVKSIGSGAFEECSGLTSVTIPNRVTAIEQFAFCGCNNLKSVTIGKSVSSIDPSAFSYCANLSNISVASENKNYNDGNGSNCIIRDYKLIVGCKATVIPNSVFSIGEYAFEGCSNMTSITIPNSVSSICSSAFYKCSSLKSIDISSSVTSIGVGAFAYCSNLTSIIIPDSVYSIGEGAFSDCSNLTNINIPNSVTTISNSIFLRCSSLASVTIPNSVISIGGYAFSGCSSLTSITIPNCVTEIGERAFLDCSSLDTIFVSWNNPLTITSDVFSGIDKYKCTLYVPWGCVDEYQTANVWQNFTDIRETTCPNDEIWYTAGEKLPETISDWGAGLHTNAFNTTILSHTFNDGKGVIKFDSDVTSIEMYAFRDCSSLTSIIIPNTVTNIGHGAFSGCTSLPVENNLRYADTYLVEAVDKTLSTYTIKDGTNWIGYGAFSGCSSLTSITLPNSVTSIGEYAFDCCKGLTSVTIGDSVTSIGSYAFYYCSGLTSITIPNSVTSIGVGAFEICSGLTSVTIPNSVTSIEDYAFYYCSGLTSITIPNSVTSIGNYAFYYCSDLTSVTVEWTDIANIVTPAGKSFYNVDFSKATLYVPAGTKALYKAADVWKNFGTIEEESIPNDEIWYTASEKLPETIYDWGSGLHTNAFNTTISSHSFSDGKGIIKFDGDVTSFEMYAFRDCSSLTSIIIPNTVTNIGHGAFSGCTCLPVENNLRYADAYLVEAVDKTLSTYTIKEDTKWIGHYAFSNCSHLTSIIIPNSVKSIEWWAFDDCSNLTSVTIGNSVISIGRNAFYKCSGLTSVTIPNSVTSIGELAFQDCFGLTSVTIGDSVSSIGMGAFSSCSGLISVIIPNSVSSIGAFAFNECTSLASVTIGNSVKSIEQATFSKCSSLASVTIPNSVTSIDYSAFTACSSLSSISVTSGNTVYDSRENCNAIIETSTKTLIAGCKNTIIPNSVTGIGASAFFDCSGLTSASIPNSVTSIGDYAFRGCSGLTSVTIPKSVTSIGAYAFQNMTSLKEMYVHWDEPLTVAANILNGASTGSATLYVPSSAVDAYKSAAVWKNFGTITFSGEEPYNFLAVDKNGDEIKKEVEAYDDVVLYDNHKNLTIIEDIGNVNITYSRTFKNANWQPLYVPFDMTVTSDLLQRFSFAKFAGTYTEQDNSGNVAFFITIVRLKEGATIKANTPYFIQAKTADASNAQTISVDGTTLHKTEEMNFSMYSAEKKLSVYGIYNQKICAYDGEYYAYSAGKYSKQLTGAKLGAFRFYVTIENREDNPYGTSTPADIKLKLVGDDATGISNANVDADINGNCFNLAGQVVGPDYKGIVIKNGKKMYNNK